ncbi:DUF2314 domain-containing protein [Hymenobacter sp. DG25B]|uniref:DUF2314 domain-containing protein n=1 Tax=Hymenobacter sp. DG25B TaxID=1385664 RepID=UPI0009E1F884|nr:DUF2314 domain-containing protein [Hymenobacter sp. DG25B]
MRVCSPSSLVLGALAAALLVFAAPAQAQKAPTKSPTDMPARLVGTELAAIVHDVDATLAQPIRQARQKLSSVKKRYAAGLPAGQTLYLTTRIFDSDGQFEQVFVRVSSWQDKIVTGTLANKLEAVHEYQPNQSITFPEQAVLDWTITAADGQEEGNYVGKFIDRLQSKGKE